MPIALATDDNPFDEVMEFLTGQRTPQEVIAYELPQSLVERMQVLREQNDRNVLGLKGRTELDQFMGLNQILEMLKDRARRELDQS